MRRLIVHNEGSRRGGEVAAALRRRAGTDAGTRWVAIDDLARERASVDRVVVVGGDGTVNAALSWLLREGFAASVAIVPAGTGNNLARGLGVPLAVDEAWELAERDGPLRHVDGIVWTTEEGETGLLVQSGAMGFPADIGARYERLRRYRAFRALAAGLGPAVYVWLALAGLVRQKLREWSGDPGLDVRAMLPDVDGLERVVSEPVIALFVGNEPTLGGGFVPCPLAALDDGLVDLCVLRAGTGASYLRVFGRVLRGAHLQLTETVVYRRSPGPIRIELSRPVGLLADGDLRGPSRRWTLRLHPRRFPIRVPSALR